MEVGRSGRGVFTAPVMIMTMFAGCWPARTLRRCWRTLTRISVWSAPAWCPTAAMACRSRVRTRDARRSSPNCCCCCWNHRKWSVAVPPTTMTVAIGTDCWMLESCCCWRRRVNSRRARMCVLRQLMTWRRRGRLKSSVAKRIRSATTDLTQRTVARLFPLLWKHSLEIGRKREDPN